MGFLKRLFSLRHKQKAARGDGRDNNDTNKLQPTQRLDADDTRVWQQGYDEHAAFRSRWPKNGKKDEDPEVAITRLLRSSSANYKVVKEADYTKLPPLPHPINTISARSTSALTDRSASIQTKGSYRVTVHKRQQLSATVFPNAYPPITPRRPGVAHTSTPNLLTTLSVSENALPAASTSTSALVDPRKIPFTPRDANRLSRLRQDPSVLSLIKMYDEHGRLSENAFTTTPAPSRRRRLKVRKSRRKSTFNELLGCNPDDNMQWAEACIAREGGMASDISISNASTSSLSSTDTPPLDSPATSTFNDVDFDQDVPTPAPAIARDPSASTVTGLDRDAGFSSLVVELSVASTGANLDPNDKPTPYLGPFPCSQHEGTKGNDRPIEETTRQSIEMTNDSNPQDRTMTVSKVGRKPSHRASQVFNFIGERRERRKSQELLQSSTLSASESERDLAPSTIAVEPADTNKGAVKFATIPRMKSPSPMPNLTGSSGSRSQLQTKSAQVMRDLEPAPERPALVNPRPFIRPPNPRTRSKSNSCSQVTGTALRRVAAEGSTCTLPGSYPAYNVGSIEKPTKIDTVALVQPQKEREREKEQKQAKASRRRDEQMLPVTSTPHPSKVSRNKEGTKASFAPLRDRAALGERSNEVESGKSDRLDVVDLRYDNFAASLDARMQQMQMRPFEKENAGKIKTRRRGATITLGVTRTATTTLPTSKYTNVGAPQTPTRSLSLRGPDIGQSSSSELSPHTAQLMADLRTRRALARARAERVDQTATVKLS